MQTCRACGKSTTDDAKFCPTCGTYFPGAELSGGRPGDAGTVPPPAPPAPPAPAWGVPTGSQVRARPLGITILSLLDALGGAVALLLGLAFVAAGPSLGEDPQVRQALLESGLTADMIGPVFAVIGLLLVLGGVLGMLIGYGLWHGRSWAWTGFVVLQALGVAFGALMLVVELATGNVGAFGRLFGIAIGGFLLWYFLQPGVKAWFGKQPAHEPGLPSYVPPPPPMPPGSPPPGM